MKALLRRVGGLIASPVRDLNAVERAVLLVVAVIHVTGIGWGLPASDGWDVDGIAPRDFLPGVIKTFTPGDHFTYPPFHLALLTLLTLPVTLVELVRAPSLDPSDVVPLFLAVPVMTTFAYVARVVSFLMSLGVVLMIGRMASTIFAARWARAWAMAASGVEVAGTYYAHTTNLDMPALFWSALALLVLVRAIDGDDPRKLRRVAVFAAFALATKDQAYAVFAITMPVALASWVWLRPPGGRAEVVRESALCLAIVVGLVLVIDGALFNPSGFAARVRFLTGSASQDFAQHSRDLAGRLSALEDALFFFPRHYPAPLAAFVLAGLVVAIRGAQSGRSRLAALVPLLAIVSFTLAFNCVARRVEERFMMVQMQLCAVYAGGVAALVERWASRRALALGVWLGAAACVLLGLRMSGAVVVTMLNDARYDAERFLREHVRPGEVIEVYGANVYLPRLPAHATVERVDPAPVEGRNPMPGITERRDRVGAVDERRPRWIVVGMGHAWRYLQEPVDGGGGRILPPVQRAGLADDDTREHIRALFAERAGYRITRIFHDEGTWLFPPRPLHASLATDVFVFERM